MAMQNHFELFQLAQRFEIDAAALDTAYREVQGRVHPDRFASAPDAERRVAMQWATRANEAYQVLRNPFKRAAYLCELNGVDLEVESNTAMPRDFLMLQMEWREQLQHAQAEKNIGALEALEQSLKMERERTMEELRPLLDTGDFHAAAQLVRRLMFLDRFGSEIGQAYESAEG
jgi:molecular chaperone HscB